MCREAAFDQAYVFKYSQRRDTPAASMPDQLSEAGIEERHARLLAQVNEIASRKYADRVGRTVEILVEGPSRRNPARFEGRTRDNRIVIFEGDARHRGQLLRVQVETASAFTLYGIPELLGISETEEPGTNAATSLS